MRGCITCKTSIWKFLAGNWSSSQDFRVPASRPWLSIRSIAEGQRRYIETFSAYARNFLGNLERPDVDKITGLSPVISIEQKTTNKNPRSTVGTTTEVYDYLRLLYARAGEAYSYLSGEKMVKYTEEQILDLILKDTKENAFISLLRWCAAVRGITRSSSSRCARKAISTYVWTVRYAKSCPA